MKLTGRPAPSREKRISGDKFKTLIGSNNKHPRTSSCWNNDGLATIHTMSVLVGLRLGLALQPGIFGSVFALADFDGFEQLAILAGHNILRHLCEVLLLTLLFFFLMLLLSQDVVGIFPYFFLLLLFNFDDSLSTKLGQLFFSSGNIAFGIAVIHER